MSTIADKYSIKAYLQPRPEPQKPTGSLNESYAYSDLTPIIGREYPNIKLAELLDSDKLLRDLAIIISTRGVVVFRNQSLTLDEQKMLAQKLGSLTGKPATSKLHIHPLLNDGLEESVGDKEISVLSTTHGQARYKNRFATPPGKSGKKPAAVRFWHNDTAYENITSDYSILKILELPPTGGDTLWASGYEMYNRLSTPFQKFFEGLTASFAQPVYQQTAKEDVKCSIYTAPRGAPENIGSTFDAVHPVIRTNPVTGMNSIYAFGQHLDHINEVTDNESQRIMDMIKGLLVENHDLQVRWRWSKNDVAIWDNRSVFHTATHDHNGPRMGVRSVGIGEKSFLAV